MGSEINSTRRYRRALATLRKAIGRPSIASMGGRIAFDRFRRKPNTRLMAVLLRENDFQGFCEAIGFIAVNWALFEHQLDLWVLLIFKKLDGQQVSTRVPKLFSEKSTFLRRAFNQIPALALFKDKVDEILNQATQLANTRNDLVHSVATHIKPKAGRYEMSNLKLDRDAQAIIKKVVFDVNQYPKLVKELMGLESDALQISKDLSDQFGEP